MRKSPRSAVFTLMLLPASFLFVFDKNQPERHEDIVEHFKYGSIGAEERAGVPYEIWRVLPALFPEHLPQRSGNGYEKFGLLFETPDKARPIGSSYRQRQVALVGLNCAVCHTGVLRDAPGAPRRIILGMPAHQFDLQSYEEFFFACARDPRFTEDYILSGIRSANPKFSWFDALLYRWFVIPRTKSGILEQSRNFAWFEGRPRQGPGRVDTFNPYKVMFGFDMTGDLTIGTADLPSLWNQRVREGLWLHWDGNNSAVTERNKSAAIGAGASEASLDLESMKRVEDWILDLKPPEFPRDKIDMGRVTAGKKLFDAHCSECHELGRPLIGQTIEQVQIGTDPERVNSFTRELCDKMNTLGTGRPWNFSHFRKTEGYAAMPLDGIWLRAPYLHNGSVPTLRDLLKPPEERPTVFWRGYDVYDYVNVGFVSDGEEARREGFRFDTVLKGNRREGHTYGTNLRAGEKDDLIEFLKTL